jgi:hypothetical protein
LKIVAADWDSYQRFLSERLTAAPNVAHVKSALMLRVSKAATGVPLGEIDALPGESQHRSPGESRGPLIRAQGG